MKKQIKTTRKEIVEYWEQHVYEGDLGVDFDDAETRCWRCGKERSRNGLDRCHIIPEQEPFYGKDEPSNFVLLCSRCHKEAPDVGDKETMFSWIKATRCGSYGEFDENRVFELFEKVYNNPIETFLSTT